MPTGCVRIYGRPPVRLPACPAQATAVALRCGRAASVQVEAQAQDRIHRLGQYKPITVVRFVIAGTIEERILKLQVRGQARPGGAGRGVRACVHGEVWSG